MSNTPKTEQDYFQQSKELTNEQEKEGQTLYDPYKNAPLSMNERLYFNISIVYVTLISSFVFALVMVARPSFFSAFLGLVWAMPGLLVLIGFNRGRAKKRLRTFHTLCLMKKVFVFVMIVLLGFGLAAQTSKKRKKKPATPKPVAPVEVALPERCSDCLFAVKLQVDVPFGPTEPLNGPGFVSEIRREPASFLSTTILPVSFSFTYISAVVL